MPGGHPDDAKGGIPQKEQDFIRETVADSYEDSLTFGILFMHLGDKKRLEFWFNALLEYNDSLGVDNETLRYMKEKLNYGN